MVMIPLLLLLTCSFIFQSNGRSALKTILIPVAVKGSGECSTKPSSVKDIAGDYILISASGKDLPAVVSENPATGYKQEITGGSVTLRAGHTFAWRTSYRQTQDGKVESNESSGGGKYSLSEDVITFYFQPGSDQLSGTVRGDKLIVKADVELIYKRR